jgi:hypothetical protein
MSMRGRPISASVAHNKDAGVLNVTIEGENLTPPDRVNFTREVKCVNGFSTSVHETRDFGNASVGHVNYSITEDRYALAEDGSFIVYRSSQLELRNSFGDPEKRWGEWWFRFKPQRPINSK